MPKFENLPSGVRFILLAIFGLFCSAKIDKEGFDGARLEQYPVNPKSGARFDFS